MKHPNLPKGSKVRVMREDHKGELATVMGPDELEGKYLCVILDKDTNFLQLEAEEYELI